MSTPTPVPSGHSRRQLVQLGLALPWWLRLFQERRVERAPDGEARFVDPPGAVPEALAKRLSEFESALVAGKARANEVLADPASDALRPFQSFRDLIARHAESGRAVLVPKGEPGTALLATVVALDQQGNACPDARVYAYQTSAKGWYAAEAPHVSGNSGDFRHARLFAHGRTDAAGHCELVTVRPGPYPRSELPSHIHLVLAASTGPELVTEIRFADCPRMTPAERAASERSGFVVVPVELRADGHTRCEAEFVLPG